MLLVVERAKEACGVLAAIAGDPHGEGAGSTARRLVQLMDSMPNDSMPNGRNPTQEEIGAALSSNSDAAAAKQPPPDEGVRVPPQPNEA